MSRINFRKLGWMNRYLYFRSKTPFPLTGEHLNYNENSISFDNFDSCLYSIVKDNGILLGCPVISSDLNNLAKLLNFPVQRGGTILLYLETLFSVALIENQILITNSSYLEEINSYQKSLLKILLLIIKYYLPDSYYHVPEDQTLTDLLDMSESLNGALQKLEIKIIEEVTIEGYSSLGNRQNIFSFAKIYFFILWARENVDSEVSEPEKFRALDKRLREDMILTFSRLIWADNIVVDTEKQVIKKYLEQSGLNKSRLKNLKLRISKTLTISELNFAFNNEIICKYVIEQLILLSMINNQEVWEEREMIEKISRCLGFSDKKIEQLYYEVALFFSKHYERLEFLKNNAAFTEFQDYMNDKLLILVRKNLSNIMSEIKETKELSEILIKATKSSLTSHEKQKAKEQLIDIARSIPALAIIAMPGGSIFFSILVKVLPFNILPSSFQEE